MNMTNEQTPAPLSWPCPDHCETWCRTEWRDSVMRGRNAKNHHPNCKYVDASLIDVWRVTLPDDEPDKGGCIFDSHAAAISFAESEGEGEEDALQIHQEKMHKEIYERLQDFAGF